MKTRLTNALAAEYADACGAYLDQTGLLGYACARNARRLTDAALEYVRLKDEAVRKHGTEVKDERGNVTGYTIAPGSDAMAAFVSELSPIAGFEVECDIVKVPPSEVIGKLTGREVFDLDWMIEDGGD